MSQEKKLKPTPEDFGWIAQEGFGDDDHGWMFEGGEEEYYKALEKWNTEKLHELFDEQGMCLNDKRTYFDKDGDLIEPALFSTNYANYPAKSDIVKMYFAQEYASETHGNYTAQILYWRAY